MQMQGYEAMWQLVLDAHLHCVYPGRPPPGSYVSRPSPSRPDADQAEAQS